MSESQSYRPDQAASVAPQQQYGEQFTVPTTFTQPETPESFLADETVARATSDVEQAYQTTPADERFVFTDERSRSFEIRQEQPAPTVSREANMLDDSYTEMVRARQEAAALQAEHEALDAQNVQAVAVSGQLVNASRDFAEKYGLAA